MYSTNHSLAKNPSKSYSLQLKGTLHTHKLSPTGWSFYLFSCCLPCSVHSTHPSSPEKPSALSLSLPNVQIFVLPAQYSDLGPKTSKALLTIPSR